MAWKRITAQDQQGEGASTLSLTYPTTPTKGRLLVCTVVNTAVSVPTVEDSAGAWTRAEDENGGGSQPTCAIFFKIATASQSKTVVIERKSGTLHASIHEWEGNAEGEVLTQKYGSWGETSVSEAGGAFVTTASPDNLIVSVMGLNGPSEGPFAPTTGSPISEDELSAASEYLQEKPGYIQPRFSWTHKRKWVSVVVSFAAASPPSNFLEVF
jgi:hypothetical protein